MKKTLFAVRFLLAGSILFGVGCAKLSLRLLSDTTAKEPAASGAVTPALGSVLWNGDAVNGAGVWKVAQNIDGSGIITTPMDPVYALVWQFYKPAGSHRTEAHGAAGFTAQEGDDIYIGWRSKLTMPANVNTNAVFQWKAYGSGHPMLQNYPIVVSTDNQNHLHVMYYAPGKVGHEIWKTALRNNTWNSFVFRLKISRDSTVGFIEWWYNGTHQTLANGTTRYSARTLDADLCDPKWGVYGGDPANITNQVTSLRIATSYNSAAPH